MTTTATRNDKRDTSALVILLNNKSCKELCELFNRATGGSVKRFATKSAGLNRIYKMLKTDPTASEKLFAITTAGDAEAAIIEVFDDGSPMETAAEVVTKAVKAKVKKQKKNKELDQPQPIKNSKLVSYRGRVIRPENADVIGRGDDLWGSCSKAPSDKDRLKGPQAKLNLNYPAKEKIVEPREGTMRYKLIKLMEGKGVTIPQVAKLFKITEPAAIYKLRDLHYVGGNGLRMEQGRVFLQG